MLAVHQQTPEELRAECLMGAAVQMEAHQEERQAGQAEMEAEVEVAGLQLPE